MNTYKELRKAINKPIADIFKKFSPTDISECSVRIYYNPLFQNGMIIECSIIKNKDFFINASNNIDDIKIKISFDDLKKRKGICVYEYLHHYADQHEEYHVMTEVDEHFFDLTSKLLLNSKDGFVHSDFSMSKTSTCYFFKIKKSVIKIDWIDLMTKNIFIDYLENIDSNLNIDESNINLISKYLQPFLNNDKITKKPIFFNKITDFIAKFPFSNDFKEEELLEYLELFYAK